MVEDQKYLSQCSKCYVENKICKQPEGSHPKFCATTNYQTAIQEAEKELKKPDINIFAKMSSLQEAECYAYRKDKLGYKYPTKPRVQEIMEFAKKMNYKKLGIAFCSGLAKEAEILTKMLENQNFEVVSVICKVGGIDKSFLGLSEDQKIKIGEYESMCNPIAQAKVLNEANTDFNIILGLCVGHDSLFMKYSKAMATVLVAKDRLLGHNPIAAIYTSHSYYDRFMSPDYTI